MAQSFADRLDVFCADFACVAQALKSQPELSEDVVARALSRNANEDEQEFCLRAKGAFRAYSYVLENRPAFQNVGFLLGTGGDCEKIEGRLLYALCLHLAANDSALEDEPDLEQIIDTALLGPV